MFFQGLFDDFKNKYPNDKVIVYGAGIRSFAIFVHNNLSAINIVGILDKKFENKINQKFFNINAYGPN